MDTSELHSSYGKSKIHTSTIEIGGQIQGARLTIGMGLTAYLGEVDIGAL